MIFLEVLVGIGGNKSLPGQGLRVARATHSILQKSARADF